MAKSKKEQQNEEVSIAVMATDISYIKESIKGIEATLKIMDGNFVKKDDLKEMIKIDDDHEKRIRRMETWGFTAIGALAVIQFALNYFK